MNGEVDVFRKTIQTTNTLFHDLEGVLQKHITKGEYRDIIRMMPEEIRQLLPG